MKLLQVRIHGFGKYYQQDFSFQDGIHVLYGPNEAGKSTLHTFLGCMLFGLERGRGRAAKGDLYSKYLPWDHDGSYGGSLSFESEDEICLLERTFRSDNRSCIFTAPARGRVLCRDNEVPLSYYEGLTESLYYNTVSVRQLGSAADSTLADELGKRLGDIHQTGSDTINYNAAAAWLKAARKKQEALLDPTLEKRTLRLKQELAELNGKIQQSSFQEEKAMLERQMEECMEELAAIHPDSDSSHGRQDTKQSDRNSRPRGRRHDRKSPRLLLPILLTLGFLALALFLWQSEQASAAAASGVAALLSGVLVLLRAVSQRNRDTDHLDENEFDDDELTEDEFDSPTARRLRLRMQSLQKRYQEVNRREWEQERLLEKAQNIEEELEALARQQAAEEDIRLEIQAINLAQSTLQRISGELRDSFGPHLNSAMSRILSGLTGGVYTEVYVDSQLNVTVHTGLRTVPLDCLSRGTIEQIHLAMRLAVIDLLFPQGGMPLLLDDCFLAYDDGRLSQTLNWLAENYSGQVFIFTCQKREAALLQQEQIPFTFIPL